MYAMLPAAAAFEEWPLEGPSRARGPRLANVEGDTY